MMPLIGSGIVLGVGYILIGIALIKSKVLPISAILMLTLGALIFGNGIVLPVRTLGLLGLSTAMVWIGILMNRMEAK
jgi:hypothetical protein